MASKKTASQLLDHAEELIKSRGVNAFSFKDLQHAVGIKTSSIHYHFATKAELLAAVFERFFNSHKESLEQLDKTELSPEQKLKQLGSFFLKNSQKGELCLGGMLSSDAYTLSEADSQSLDKFFTHFENWVVCQLQVGIEKGEFREEIKPEYKARLFIALLEGGMLIARVRSEKDYFKSLLDGFLEGLKK